MATALELTTFTAAADSNTDINSRILFRAPELVYGERIPPHQLLFEVTQLSESLNPSPELKNYIRALNVYLTGLLLDQTGKTEEALEAFIQSAALSPDFTLGYAHCLTYASLIAREFPNKAAALLERLIEAQPNRPVAKQLLDRLRKP